MTQTQYGGNLARGYPGQLYGDPSLHAIRSVVNDTGAVRQVDTITVSTAVGSTTTYTFTIDGVTVSFTSDSSSKTVIRDGLIAAVREIVDFEGLLAANPSSTDKLTLTALVPGTGFTTAESDSNLALANTQANVARLNIPFGRGVVFRHVPQSWAVTISTAADSTAYAITIAGVTVTITSGSSSATKTEIRDALIAEAVRLQGDGLGLAHLRGLIVLDTLSTDGLTVTILQPGLDVTVAEADSNIATPVEVASATDTGASDESVELPGSEYDLFAGVIVRSHSNVGSPVASGNVAVLAPGQDGSACYRGPIYVETTGTVRRGDKVFMIFSGASNLGKFTNSEASGTARAIPATFDESRTGAGLVRIDLAA